MENEDATYYDVDYTLKGIKKDYEEGNQIPWLLAITHTTKKEALESFRHFKIKSAGTRIVKVTNPEYDPLIKDIKVWFRN